MINANGRPNNADGGDEGRWQQPSAERREPQLNKTVCSCDCSFRGCVTGETEGGGRGDTEDTEREWMRGDEGVDLRMLADAHMASDLALQTPVPEQYDPFNIPTQFAEYEFGRRGFVLQHRVPEVEPFEAALNELALQRINSNESLRMHANSSGEPSVISNGYLSVRPESPAQLVFGADGWANAILNSRSGYFFITTPLPLVAPLRCACHAETGTESDSNSSADLYTDGSIYSENTVDDDSSD